jgi:hypothetical protein
MLVEDIMVEGGMVTLMTTTMERERAVGAGDKVWAPLSTSHYLPIMLSNYEPING